MARDYSILYFTGDDVTNTTLHATAAATGGFGENGVQRTILTTTSADHGYKAGSHVLITGSTNYDGMRYIEAVSANNKITIRGKFVAETPAGTETVRTAVYFDKPWELLGFRVHLNAASATSENLVVAKDSAKASAYDTKLYTKDMNGVQDIVYNFETPIALDPKDVVTFTWANTNEKTYGIEVLHRVAS